MLKFLKWFLGLFSRYVNPFERKVGRFFKHIKSTDTIYSIKKELLSLMQENLMILNVWLEKEFRGYTYLDKKTRRKMYEDEKKIVAKFQEFCAMNVPNSADLKAYFKERGFTYPDGDDQKLLYLSQIMDFLRPGKYYHYIKTASFGKLLRDPDSAKMEGDCNQIVTFYMYLYSLKFPVEDLNIKLLPEHVCLHFRSIDIEATNATFAKYTESLEVLPATEIISTNLLDLSDFREEAQEISPRVILKSAQLAYAISSLKSLVAKNLDVAYRNLTVNLLNQQQFDEARFFAEKTGDFELIKNVKYNQAVYLYNAGILDKALEVFSAMGDEKMKKACYQKMYNKLVGEVAGVQTLDQAKSKKSIYQKMLDLAVKVGDPAMERSVRETLGKI